MALTVKPDSLSQLAEQLVGVNFKRITAIADILGVGSAKDFFDNIPNSDIITSPNFAISIPIVYENISVKKYDYTLVTNIIFWLADGEPYIFTPPPTIQQIRHGRSYKELKRGGQLGIPSNVKRFEVLALTQRCEHEHELDEPAKSLTLSITRYQR